MAGIRDIYIATPSLLFRLLQVSICPLRSRNLLFGRTEDDILGNTVILVTLRYCTLQLAFERRNCRGICNPDFPDLLP